MQRTCAPDDVKSTVEIEPTAQEKGATAVFLSAAAEGNLSVMRTAAKEPGVDIHAVNDDGQNAVCISTQHGNHELIRELHIMGVSINFPDRIGETPAYIAVAQDDAVALRTLFECGVDLNVCEVSMQIVSLFLVAAVHVQEGGRVEILNVLYEFGVNVHAQSLTGQNAAHLAAQSGRDLMIRALHSMGVNLDVQDDNGQTPAFLAVIHCHATVLTALSACGVDVNGGRHKDPRINLFYEAVKRGDLAVMTVLVECGVDVHARCIRAGETVAHTAARHGQHHVFAELQRLGASLDSADVYGGSPAVIAAARGDMESLRVLRECGVDLLQSSGTKGWSPLQAAKDKNNLDVVQCLEELHESTDTSAKQAENALLDTLDAEETAKSNKVARNKQKKDRKSSRGPAHAARRTAFLAAKSATNNASRTTIDLGIASAEVANLEPTLDDSKIPPHQVNCHGLPVVRS